MLLCLSAAPIPQTCSAKPIYCNPVLLKGVNRQSAMAGCPQLLPKCPLQTSQLFWRTLGCQVSHDPCARVPYRSSVWLPAATHAVKAAAPHCKSKTFMFRALGCHFGEQQRCERGPKGPGSIKKGPSHRDCGQVSGK